MKEEETKDMNDGDDEINEFLAENMITIAFGEVSISIGSDASLDELF